MKYFKNVKNVKELKETFKKLARENHPDMGGDVEVMKAINTEFEILLATLPKETRTAVKTEVSEFYTQNGWKGSNYEAFMSTKDIAAKVREFVKAIYPECKFSVTFSTASMCSEIHVALVEAPYRLNKTVEELTDEELYDGSYSYNYQYGRETDDKQKERFLKTCYTKEVQYIMNDVNKFVESYRYDDSDGMIDYFDTNFYYFGVKAGKWNKPYVMNEARASKKRKVVVEV